MKKVFSILLSFLLLVSHMSFIVGTHYCGGETVESKLILGETHLGCDMSLGSMSCSVTGEADSHQVTIENQPCCENEYQSFQLTNEFVKEASSITFSVNVALAFVNVDTFLERFSTGTPHSFIDYSPPPLEQDLQVLFQTFLI